MRRRFPNDPDAAYIPTESEEQQALFRWAAYESGAYPELRLLYHIPNEGQRSRATGGRLRAEGLKRGVPDICLPVARGDSHGLYIELKRTKHSRIEPEQGEWLRAIMRQGYCAALCYGWEAASSLIVRYLNSELSCAEASDAIEDRLNRIRTRRREGSGNDITR